MTEEINEIISLANKKNREEQIDGNFLTFYSTTHGYLAWGHAMRGSNPFQILCDKLTIYGFRSTLDDIILDKPVLLGKTKCLLQHKSSRTVLSHVQEVALGQPVCLLDPLIEPGRRERLAQRTRT